tara:strand:+ start:129 stop:893 length:765 start_codon:yes stop_codon:yes gene_type:complete
MTEEIREKIIDRFMKNVYGKIPDTTGSNERHDGKEGHWLEKKMGVEPNASNTADLFGYEMKNDTMMKTTFGDWSPNYWIFRDSQYDMTREDFLRIFGKANKHKGGRLSWSGEPVPKINGTNSFGVKTVIDESNNISFVYSYQNDTREEKAEKVPEKLRQGEIIIAKWNAEGKNSLREKLERKFNQSGWFKCKIGQRGYEEIVFGGPMNFETFMKHVKTGEIFFDSGMYEGNSRNYCQWRAQNSFWDSLIISRHP